MTSIPANLPEQPGQQDQPASIEQTPISDVILDDTDLRLIHEQLEHQQAETDEERANFAAAYLEAKRFAFTQDLTGLTDEQVADLVLLYAKMTFPIKNQYGLKSFQTTHNETGEPIGSPPGNILESDISRWCEEFAAAEKPTDQLFFEFENIHPFQDGNGRVGHLMWAIDQKRRIGQWPTTLPPEYEDPDPPYKDASDFLQQ